MNNTIAASLSPKNKPRRKTSSPLARKTFHAFRPFINVDKCGYWCEPYDASDERPAGPRFLITEQQWRWLHEHRQGVRGQVYRNGYPFYPQDVLYNVLAPRHVHKMVHEFDKYYYSGGQHGLAMPMIDIDAHEDEDDQDDVRRDLEEVLGAGNAFVVVSKRGLNLFVKIDYRAYGPAVYNHALGRLQRALQRYTAHRKCVVEVKGKVKHAAGTIKVNGKEIKRKKTCGTLAKLPCYGKPGTWTFERLAEFEALPVQPITWLFAIIDRLEAANADRQDGPAKAAPAKTTSGSCVGVSIARNVVEQLPDAVRHYHRLSLYLYSQHEPPTRKDVRLTAVDFACALAVVNAFLSNSKADHSLPQAAVKRLWGQAYADGLLARPFNDSRWSAIWKTLANAGVIDVVDERYWWSADKSDSQCMRWCLKQEYAYRGQEEAEKKHIATGQITLPPYRAGRYRPIPVYRRPAEVGCDIWDWEKEAEVDLTLCDASECL
jgi:hypothetical protein